MKEAPKKLKRLYYLPGLISLCCIPVTLVCFYEKWLAAKLHLGAIEVNWYKSGFHPWSIPSRQYLNITLTGNIDSDEVRIRFGELRMKEINANRDTINGINFSFGDKTKYEEFVQVLDICNMYCPYYAASDSGIKIFNLPEHKPTWTSPPLPRM